MVLALVVHSSEEDLNTYFLCGIMEVIMGVMRGLGYSISPMLISLTGACIFRIFWRYVFFPLEPLNTPTGLLLSFPISWVLTIAMLLVLFACSWKKMKKMFSNSETEKESEEPVEA